MVSRGGTRHASHPPNIFAGALSLSMLVGVLGVVVLQFAAVAHSAATFPANTAVAHVDFSRQTSNLYVVSDRIQYAMMEQDILAWNSARVRVTRETRSTPQSGFGFNSIRLGALGEPLRDTVTRAYTRTRCTRVGRWRGSGEQAQEQGGT